MGLFPDNFVELIGVKNESQEQESPWGHEVASLSAKSSIKHSHQAKKTEKAHVRKSLDSSNAHTSNISGEIRDYFAPNFFYPHGRSFTSSITRNAISCPVRSFPRDRHH